MKSTSIIFQKHLYLFYFTTNDGKTSAWNEAVDDEEVSKLDEAAGDNGLSLKKLNLKQAR